MRINKALVLFYILVGLIPYFGTADKIHPQTLYLSSLHNETTAPVSGGFLCAIVVTGVMQLPSREGPPQP